MKTKYFSIFLDGNALCVMLGSPKIHDLATTKAWFFTLPKGK